ncbi:MAG: 2-phosphosulfolactate phosphatase [Bacteroidota bacterium]|jgi:2-phosphosulfolactate phosphatase|nr:2-phosphosulfolactate phosphatase [Bacteroidota bacterium]
MKSKNHIPTLNTVLSPSLLHLYDISNSIVVIIDILRATSTIATALFNGAKEIIPVESVAECIKLGRQIDVITAGERDGQIAEGLQYGNTPFQYDAEFIKGKTLVLTTTNGTKLLHMALKANAKGIITGSFCNLSAVCDYLSNQNKNVMLACAGWKNRINIEDSLFAGAVINRIKNNFEVNCDASQISETLYLEAKEDPFTFLKEKNASHYHRLMRFGLEKDIRYCLSEDSANILSIFVNGRLVAS